MSSTNFKLIYTYPNGLAVYKTKLLPHSPDEVLCVGGPVLTLEGIIENRGGHSTAVIGHMTQFITALKSHVPKSEYFPDNEDFEIHAEKEWNCYGLKNDMVESCKEVKDKLLGKDFDIKNSTTAVQSEFEKYMKIQESGLDRGFKCVKCRGCDECLKGSGYEKISLKQEYEQNLIKQSDILGCPIFAKSSKIPSFCTFSHYIGNYKTTVKKLGSWDSYKGCLKGQTFYKGIGSKIQRKIWQLSFLHFMLQI